MDRLDEFAVLVAVIDAGSLAGAARRLRRSPPAVTRTLAALEDRVGASLVERTTRRLSPTEHGLTLAARARELLADYEALTSSAPAAPLQGLLRVTAPVQFGRHHVVPIVDAFLNAYPAMSVELVLNDRNLDLVEEGARKFDDLPSLHPYGQDPRWSMGTPAGTDHCYGRPRWAFAGDWNARYAAKGFAWENNPKVWVTTFKVLTLLGGANGEDRHG